jgi:hypothetical protein
MVKKKKSVEKKQEVKIGKGFGVAGFILGIESIIFSLLIPGIGIILSINGFIFCIMQQKRNSTKKGKVGLILNIVGFILGIIIIVLLISIYYLSPLLKDQLTNFPA